jgi:hypothetical protein
MAKRPVERVLAQRSICLLAKNVSGPLYWLTSALHEESTRAHFGIPVEDLPVSAQEQHLLYPELGLDLVLNADGKDVLQYLSPNDFDVHRAQLHVK